MRRMVLVVGLSLPASALAQSQSSIGVALTGIPTAPTATVGTNTDQIATTAFVQASSGAMGANVSSSMVNLPGLPARSLSAHASDIYDVHDYGAPGTNTATTLATQFPGTATASLAAFAGQSIGGSNPYAWMTNPAFGLTFSIPTSTDQGGAGKSLTFLETLSGINGWSASVAAWQDPAHGNYLLQAGMGVSGSCIPSGTTVAAVGRVPGVAGYGTVTLSQTSSADCASATSITFSISPAQLQALTIDWLGIQSAMAAAWSNIQSGGSVYLPAGNYTVNHPLINAGGVTDTNVQVPNLDIHGDGVAVTRIQFPTDLGQDQCAISEATRGSSNTSMSTYHDFRIIGPSFTRVEGAAPNKMDGLCIGATARVYGLNVGNMRAGLNGIKDHWLVRDSNFANNGYGVYFAPYTSTMGNQSISDSSVAGNTIASIGVSTTNQIDSSTLTNVHTGFGPYGFYLEPAPSNVTNPLGFLTNTVLTNVWIEAVGNAWIYGAGKTGVVNGNTFIGGGFSAVGMSAPYAVSGSVAPAVIYVSSFDGNTMNNTTWSDYGSVSDAIIEASNECVGNVWLNDVGFVFSSTNAVAPLKCVNHMQEDRFLTASGDGVFRYAYPAVVAGEAMSDSGIVRVTPFSDGRSFAGITASAAAANTVVGVVTFSDYIQNVIKADPSQSISQGQPVFATTGGVAGGVDSKEAIGIAWYGSASGTSTVRVDLDPGMKGGAAGTAISLTSAGTTQATAYAVTSTSSQFTNVAAGSGVVLSIVPVGAQIEIYNDGANPLRVYPQVGGQIGSNGLNASITIVPGSSSSFRRLSTTLWHQ